MKIVVAGATGTVGRHVVASARRRGHDVVLLSRGSGHDLETGAGLADALAGTEAPGRADAVIDVSSVVTISRRRSVQFFTTVTENLLEAERVAGVGHHVALSIVGIDDIDASYYAGKLAQERAVQAGAVPHTLLRAAQFHEFAEQVVPRGSIGPLVAVPAALVRPVAAREVGEYLVELAENGPAGRVTDLVGPEDARLLDLVRSMFAADGVRRPTVGLALPGTYWRGLASGALRGASDRIEGRSTFEQWLRTPDHTPIRT